MNGNGIEDEDQAARDRIAEALMAQETSMLPEQENVAPLYAMQRPEGSGIQPGAGVNAFAVNPPEFEASEGTEDFDRMYRKAAGSGGGDSDKMQKLMMLMGGG